MESPEREELTPLELNASAVSYISLYLDRLRDPHQPRLPQATERTARRLERVRRWLSSALVLQVTSDAEIVASLFAIARNCFKFDTFG